MANRAQFMGDLSTQRQWGTTELGPRYDAYQGGYQMGQSAADTAAFRTLEQQPDADRVVSVKEWAEQPFTVESAKAVYSSLILALSIREKLSLLAGIGRDIVNNREIYNVVVAESPDFFKLSTASLDALKKVNSKPNAIVSMTNGVQALEVNIFPRFGIEVRGFMPLYRDGVVQKIRVGNIGETSRTIYDIGDLSNSSIDQDIDAMKLSIADIKSRWQLGEPVLVIIGITAVVMGILVLMGASYALFAGIVNKWRENDIPKLPDDTRKQMTPKELMEWELNRAAANAFMTQAKSFLMWGAIAAGGLSVVGFLGYLFLKE